MACVRKRRGKWVVDFRDQDGQRRWETYRTRKEANQALSARLEQLRKGSYRPAVEIPTFERTAKEWLATKIGHRPSSYVHWQTHVDVHLVPALGKLRLDQIRVRDVEAFRDERIKDGLSPSSTNKLLTTAAAIFKFAIRRDYVERNPAALAERVRTSSGEVSVTDPDANSSSGMEVNPDEVLSPQEAAKLIDAAEPGLFRTFIMTALLTGARVGELTALTWNDVDLDGSRLYIRRSVSWARHRGQKGKVEPRYYEPKTKTSRREIPLPQELVAELRKWKLACSPSALELVFPYTNDKPAHRKTLHSRGLRPALARAKLRQVTLHSLRHTFASALIMQGAPPNEVAHLLGHSSPAVTLGVYTHWWKAVKTDSVSTLARNILGGGGGSNPEPHGSKTVATGPERKTAEDVSG